MNTKQTRMTDPGPLLTSDGTLMQTGWATHLVRTYDRSAIRATRMRIKEWDYYYVGDDHYGLAFTISDLGYVAMASVAVIDFRNKEAYTQSTLSPLPLGRIGLPSTSEKGVSQYRDKSASLEFLVVDGMRHLIVDYYDFVDCLPLHAEIVLDQEPRDSMVIATPWAEDPLAFYYNQKIIGMRAIGSFTVGPVTHDFTQERSLGLLDWGRGVWTRDNTWYWSAAQGRQDNHVVGFNLGYGFGDTSTASENMFFLDGEAHKLNRVDFGIPVANAKAKLVGDRYNLMQPWHFTDNEGRLDLVFSPEVDRCDLIDLKLVTTDQHQVFGTFDGWVKLDGGTRFKITNLRGFAEAVHNVY